MQQHYSSVCARARKWLIAERGQAEARVQKASRGQGEQSQRDKKGIEERHHPRGEGWYILNNTGGELKAEGRLRSSCICDGGPEFLDRGRAQLKPREPIQSVIVRFSLQKYCRGDIKSGHGIGWDGTRQGGTRGRRLTADQPRAATPSRLHFKGRVCVQILP